jgi:catechol-2,3-dioxygenase
LARLAVSPTIPGRDRPAGFRSRRHRRPSCPPHHVPHIIAFNTWAGEGVPPAPAGASGLRHLTVALPDRDALAGLAGRLAAAGVPAADALGGLLVRDPAQNAILLTVA